ncbi:MAG TPA: peptide MFS transporter [Kofleriaceae bacterium]|nr:peptide MFS transporter [Kofleriaceae bacterium]
MSKDMDKAFFGHPAGLSTLFFTEMWERLSYYGARTFLAIYMVTPVALGGRGMSDGATGLVMALYMSSVYLLSLPGGWIADRFMGQRKAVTVGGVGIALGNAMLALPIDSLFLPGLAVIAFGTGFLKPNISTLVGQLYKPDDVRRNAGYTIYYMGINIGAGAAPLVGMFIAQSPSFRAMLADHGIDPNMCWKIGFAVPAVGMVFGLIQYFIGYKKLGTAGIQPTIPTDKVKANRDVTVLKTIAASLVVLIGGGILIDQFVYELSGELIGNIFSVGLLIAAVAVFVGFFKGARDHNERTRVAAMLPLFIGAIAFFALFEQASTTMSLYAERIVDRHLLGFYVPASFYQFWNAIFIVILAAPFAAMWLKLGKAGKEPTSVNKFGIGMIFAALSFCVMLPTLAQAETAQCLTKEGCNLVSPYYLVVFYFVSTLSELFISPVGLSSMFGLAPQRLAGMVMGTWFLATAIGNYIAGRAASISEGHGYGYLFKLLIVSALVIAAALFAVAPRIKRMMANPKASAPADHSQKAEPDPLPAARTVED